MLSLEISHPRNTVKNTVMQELPAPDWATQCGEWHRKLALSITIAGSSRHFLGGYMKRLVVGLVLAGLSSVGFAANPTLKEIKAEAECEKKHIDIAYHMYLTRILESAWTADKSKAYLRSLEKVSKPGDITPVMFASVDWLNDNEDTWRGLKTEKEFRPLAKKVCLALYK